MALRMTEEEYRDFCLRRSTFAPRQAAKAPLEQKKPKPPKYRNKKVYVYSGGLALNTKDDRIGLIEAVYDSEKEYQRHLELLQAEKVGAITDLKRQTPFVIQEACKRHGEKLRAIIYKADFSYVRNGQQVVEDVKGFDKKKQKFLTTREFDLKWKLLKFKYPDTLFELH